MDGIDGLWMQMTGKAHFVLSTKYNFERQTYQDKKCKDSWDTKSYFLCSGQTIKWRSSRRRRTPARTTSGDLGSPPTTSQRKTPTQGKLQTLLKDIKTETDTLASVRHEWPDVIQDKKVGLAKWYGLTEEKKVKLLRQLVGQLLF